MVEAKNEYVVFRVSDLKPDILRLRKLYGSYGSFYFTYKNQRIYLSEFIPQRDGSLLYIL